MSRLSGKDIETIVSRAVGSGVKVVNYHQEPFTSRKNGFLGSHDLLTIEIQRESKSNVESHTFFVKTPPESLSAKIIMESQIFHEEVNFFNEIHPLFVEICKCEKWSANCFLAKDSILVFEDLRAQGFSTRQKMQMDEKFLKLAMSTLARFHASSILAESRLGKTLKEAYPGAFEEKWYSRKIKLAQSVKLGYDTTALMADWFGLDAKLGPKIYDKAIKLLTAEEGKCNTVCHADLWNNNIMFDAGSDPTKCLLVDYQMLRYASPTTDVCSLLFLNTTPEFREKSEYDLFRYYYSILRDTLLAGEVEVEVPSYESLLNDYQERRMYGMADALLYLSGLYMNDEIIRDIFDNPASRKKWFFDYRFDTIKTELEIDSTYEKKMRSLVTELWEEAMKIFSGEDSADNSGE